jgi:hypothetical protein
MSNEFWPDHQARCTSCGRSTPYQDAKADGWKIGGLPPALKEPTILPALCWRCDRDARAAEMAKEPDPRD